MGIKYNPKRSESQIQAGNLLASAAEELKGLFYWSGGHGSSLAMGLESGMLKPIAYMEFSKKATEALKSAGFETKRIYDEKLDDFIEKVRHPLSGKDIDDFSGPSELNPNHFIQWLLGKHEISDASKMNCWEAVLYSAFWGGLLEKGHIFGFYEAAWVKENYIDIIAGALGYAENNVYNVTDEVKPARGDLVFFGGLTHVAIAVGGDTRDVMSLWTQDDGAFTKISIDSIKGNKKVECRPWPYNPPVKK